MNIKNLLSITLASLILSACGGDDGKKDSDKKSYTIGSSVGSSVGSNNNNQAQAGSYFNRCPNSDGTNEISSSKCMQGIYEGKSDQDGSVCKVSFEHYGNRIVQEFEIDGIHAELNSADNQQSFSQFYEKSKPQNPKDLFIRVTNTFGTQTFVQTVITEGQMAAQIAPHIHIVLGGQQEHYCVLDGFTAK